MAPHWVQLHGGPDPSGVFAYYTRPYIRTQENWFVSLADHVVEQARQPGRLRQLLGFDAWRGLGLVDGGEHGPAP